MENTATTSLYDKFRSSTLALRQRNRTKMLLHSLASLLATASSAQEYSYKVWEYVEVNCLGKARMPLAFRMAGIPLALGIAGIKKNSNKANQNGCADKLATAFVLNLTLL